MQQMISGIINGTPIWVWPLFLVLVMLGLRATKRRIVPAWIFYLMPLLGLLAINGVYQRGGTLVIWLVFALAYGAGIVLGYIKQQQWLISKQGGRVELRGEWVTLLTMMVVFLANFVAGFVAAVSPQLYASQSFVVVFVAMTAMASGVFFGRAWRVFRS